MKTTKDKLQLNVNEKDIVEIFNVISEILFLFSRLYSFYLFY